MGARRVDLARIVFDPGIGFGKNALQSLRLLRNVERFHGSACGCSSGTRASRSCIKSLLPTASDRDLFTVGVSLNLCRAGVDILRVHNVAAHTAAYRGWAHVE